MSTLVGRLDDVIALPPAAPGVELRALRRTDRTTLAAAYLASYPPGVAAQDLAGALAEVDATLGGDHGELVLEASPVAVSSGVLVGSVQVVRRSPWDPELDCPFVIECFVLPRARGAGVGAALLRHSAWVCSTEGERRIALRTGEGTSAAALRLYSRAGLRPVAPSP